MCVVDLAAIDKVCGPNIPGNTELHVLNADDLTTVPAVDANSHTVSTDVTLAATKFWSKFTFDKKSCQHTETEDENGQINGLVKCFFSHDDDAKRKMFMDMANGDFALTVKDGNGVVKLIESAEFKRDFDSGTAGADKNGYAVEFSYDGTPAKIYTGAIATS